MSVLAIDEYNWSIEFSSTHYSVWKYGYGVLTNHELEKFKEWFLTEFDKYEEFNKLLWLAGLQIAVPIDNDTIPGEYSIDRVTTGIERMLEVVTSMLPQYPYIQISIRRDVMENRKIYPIIDIEFDSEPFYTMEHNRPRLSLSILTNPEAGFRPEEVFEGYQQYIKLDKWKSQLHEIHIKNFLGNHKNGPYLNYSYIQPKHNEPTFY